MDFIKYVWKKKAQWANKPTMSIIFPAQNKSKVAAAKLQCRIEGKLRNHIMNTKHKHRCKKNVDFKNTKSYKLPLAHVAPLWDHWTGRRLLSTAAALLQAKHIQRDPLLLLPQPTWGSSTASYSLLSQPDLLPVKPHKEPFLKNLAHTITLGN